LHNGHGSIHVFIFMLRNSVITKLPFSPSGSGNHASLCRFSAECYDCENSELIFDCYAKNFNHLLLGLQSTP